LSFKFIVSDHIYISLGGVLNILYEARFDVFMVMIQVLLGCNTVMLW